MYDLIDLGLNAASVDAGLLGEPFDGVILSVQKDATTDGSSGSFDIEYKYPRDQSGLKNVMTVSCRYGSDKIARSIFNVIAGKRYQPFDARDVLINPAYEIGDTTVVNGIRGIASHKTMKFSALMSAELEAKDESELDHEYPYVANYLPAKKNDVRKVRSTLRVSASQILARVAEDEGNLSELSLTVGAMSAVVSGKVDAESGDVASFAWRMLPSDFTLTASGTDVFKVTSAGAEVTGKIVATSGKIGDCEIEGGVLKVGSANITSLNATVIQAGTITVDRLVTQGQNGISGGYTFYANTTTDSESITFTKDIIKCQLLQANTGVVVGNGGTGRVYIYDGGLRRTCTLKPIADCTYVIGM